MTSLLLLRHAKSAWDDQALPDIARPLNSRGLNAARQMAVHFAAQSLVPDRILCSTARRARETLAGLLPTMAGGCEIVIDDRLYRDSEDSYLPLIAELGGGTTLLVIGHNPAIQLTALELIGTGPVEQRAAIERKYPTGALARLELADDRWARLKPGTATLAAFVKPRDLPPADPPVAPGR